MQTAALQHAEEERVRVQEDLKRQLENVRLEASSQEIVNARLQEQLQQVRDPLQQLSTPVICTYILYVEDLIPLHSICYGVKCMYCAVQ